MQRWIVRTRDVEAHTGCIYSAGAFELDDRAGPLRDHLHGEITRWRSALRRSVTHAIDAGHLKPDTDADKETIRKMLENHLKFTGSTVAKAVLDDFEKELRWFVKVMPTDYRRVLEHQAEMEERARQLSERKN